MRGVAGTKQDYPVSRDSSLLEIARHSLRASISQLRVTPGILLACTLVGLYFDIDKCFWISLDNLYCVIQNRHGGFVDPAALSLKSTPCNTTRSAVCGAP